MSSSACLCFVLYNDVLNTWMCQYEHGHDSDRVIGRSPYDHIGTGHAHDLPMILSELAMLILAQNKY